ncbi:MAG: peptidase C11 [Firmicutes bacterium]|nr:peptidase C11 [Bacillota bacterium]
MPKGRERNITGEGKEIYKRGEDLGTGPVGKQDGYQGRPAGSIKPEAPQRPAQSQIKTPGPSTNKTGPQEKGETFRRGTDSETVRSFQSGQTQNRGSVPSRGLFGGKFFRYLIIAVIIYFVISFVFGNLFPGGSGSNTPSGNPNGQGGQSGQQEIQIPFNYETVTNTINSSTISGGWSQNSNSGKLDTTVANGARAKYTKLKGNGKDTVTLMVYMCGADLESRSGLGTSDIVEMCNAEIADNVNVIVYCGGTTRWMNDVLSSKTNQIIKIMSGGQVAYLSKDEGNVCMTTPSTLSGFIKFCSKEFPADRYQLILWDHGSGSLAGYGYDEKFTSRGQMGLAGISQALKDGGVKFDFVGFDACLMATAETGLMLSEYADYMVASEEVEAGYGWYYTDWLTSLSRNTSISTLDLGKQIVDDFISSCAKQVPSQKATLSLVDLAELSATMPKELKNFATATYNKIKEDYNTVATARASTREFSTQNIDQIDLVNFALNLKTQEGSDLAKSILGAVKYNKVSSNMTNAYGLSIYFPYKKASSVRTAVSTYEQIGMDGEYSRCIQAFAGATSSGQSVQQNIFSESTGGGSSILEEFLSGYGSYSQQQQSQSQQNYGSMSSQEMEQLIGTLLETLLSDKSVISASEVRSIVENNRFNADNLVWKQGENGLGIQLSGNDWSLVRDLCLNVFYDDGEGLIDLGIDNIYTITESGELLGDYDGAWIAINYQPVAYYYVDAIEDGVNDAIYGRVPALLTKSDQGAEDADPAAYGDTASMSYTKKKGTGKADRVELIVVFDNEHPLGAVIGACYDYSQMNDVEAIAKNLVAIEDGDRIDFICDYYDYSGNYNATYMMGDEIIVNGDLVVSDVMLKNQDAAYASYVFTDIFGQEYWTPIVPKY